MPQGITQTKLQEMIQAAVGPAVKLAIEGLSANRGGVDPAARIEETPRWGGGKSSEDDVGLRFGRALACIAAGKNMSGSMDVWKKQYGFGK
ncbi:MAG: hypothetical protein GY769_07645, partial [bacterium]|nr:hypothetical protein [bacterium]